MPVNDERQKRQREMMLNFAIAGGLAGTQESRSAAQVALESVLRNNPDDEEAKEISSALGAN